MEMKVSVITPTTNKSLIRSGLLHRCMEIFRMQDYENKEWIVVDDTHPRATYKLIRDTIGRKRNIGCEDATGDIILHMDDDDLYAPDWISRSVEALITSKADIAGLSNAYFHKGNDIYEYSNDKNSQLFLCGATLCYWRKTWERKPFPEVTKWPKNAGEDREFISNNGRLHCHGYKEGFLATIHGDNTCSHLAIPAMKKLPRNEAANIINRFYASPAA